jgi:hypothetical protein
MTAAEILDRLTNSSDGLFIAQFVVANNFPAVQYKLAQYGIAVNSETEALRAIASLSLYPSAVQDILTVPYLNEQTNGTGGLNDVAAMQKGKIGNFFNGILNTVGSVFTGGVNAVTGLVTGTLGAVFGGTAGIIGSTGALIGGTLGGVSNITGTALSGATPIVQSALGAVGGVTGTSGTGKSAPTPTKSNTGLIIGVVIGIVIIAAVALFAFGGKGKK